MKTIAIAAVTAGGKTTIVNELKKQIANTKVLHLTIILLKVKLMIFMNGRSRERIIVCGI